jgi:AcrR family transcriptional regulator
MVAGVTDLALTQRGEATRRRLLESAAEELVERDGQLEVASVAARANVSVGLLYRYFGSKAGLVAAVVEDFYDRLFAETGRARDLADGDDFASRERKRLELSVAFHYREPLAAVILSRLAREPEVAAAEARRIAGVVEDAARGVERGQRRGEIPAELDARLVGAMLIGGYRVALGEVLRRKRRPSAETLVEEVWRFVVSGVRFTNADGAG